MRAVLCLNFADGSALLCLCIETAHGDGWLLATPSELLRQRHFAKRCIDELKVMTVYSARRADWIAWARAVMRIALHTNPGVAEMTWDDFPPEVAEFHQNFAAHWRSR